MRLKEMGRVGLTGVPGKVASTAAGPISRRTRWSREQIEAVLGAALLALTLYRVWKLLGRSWHAGRGEEPDRAGM